MSKVQVGYMPQGITGGGGPEQTRKLLASIEDAGLDHIGVGDHVSFHVGIGFDGLLNATALSVLHPRLAVHTAVYLLPLRHPVLVARQLSSLSQLAPGRLSFGVGVGGEDRREVANCGVDPATRGRRMDECMQVLRALMAGESVSFAGEFIQVDEARILPPPTPAPPLVVGGRSNAAIDRAGRLGDGWLGLWVQLDRWREAMDRFQEAAASVGRTVDNPAHGLLVWCGIDDSKEAARQRVAGPMQMLYQTPFEKFEKYTPYGTPEDIAGFLQPFVEEGLTSIELIALGGDEAAAVAGAGEVARLLHM